MDGFDSSMASFAPFLQPSACEPCHFGAVISVPVLITGCLLEPATRAHERSWHDLMMLRLILGAWTAWS